MVLLYSLLGNTESVSQNEISIILCVAMQALCPHSWVLSFMLIKDQTKCIKHVTCYRPFSRLVPLADRHLEGDSALPYRL